MARHNNNPSSHPSPQAINAKESAGLMIPVYLPTLLLTLAQGVLIPTLPYYGQSLGFSFALISAVVAATGFGTMLADVPVGMAMERIGRKPLMVIGTMSLALSTFCLAFTGLFPLLILLRLFAGFGTAMWNISRLAYITEMVPTSERGRVLSTFGGIMRIGIFVGPALGGVVGSWFGLTSTFYLAAALGVGALVITILMIPETGSQVTGGKALSHKLRWAALGQLARTHARDLVTAGSAQVFGSMIRQGRQLIIPLYAASVIGLDIAQTGAIISISAALDMSLFIPAGYIMDRFGRKFASVPCFLIMGIGMAIMPFTRDYWGLMIACLVMALGNGLGSGIMMTLGADLAPKEATGEFLGIWRLVGDLGQTSGPLAVGAIADVFGLGLAAFSLSGIGFLAAVTLALFVRETLTPHELTAPSH